MVDNVKISELPVASVGHDTDQFETNQAGVTRAITLATMRDTILGATAPASKTIPDAAYTLLPADNGLTLRFTSAVPVTVSFPGELPVDFQTILFQAGDGAVTCVEDGTATIECGFDAAGSMHRTIDGRGFSVHAWVDDNPDGATAHYWLQGVTRS